MMLVSLRSTTSTSDVSSSVRVRAALCLSSPSATLYHCAFRKSARLMVRSLARGIPQKTQTSKLPDPAAVARTPFWSFCAG